MRQTTDGNLLGPGDPALWSTQLCCGIPAERVAQ